MSGPVALVTVNDRVCIDCANELLLSASEQPDEFSEFIENTIITDPLEAQWSVGVWGLPNDRCYSSEKGGVCEVMTARIERTWSDFVGTEDLDFSDG